MLARQIVIGFCIAFILPLLVYTGVTVFYPQPKTEDYFKQAAPPPSTATAEERQQYAAKQQSERPGQQAAYREARRAFTQALILVAAPLGIAAILIGSLVPLHSIGAGLIAGGAISVTLGYGSHWEYVDDWLRFVSLLGGLIILLLIGYRQQGLRRTS